MRARRAGATIAFETHDDGTATTRCSLGLTTVTCCRVDDARQRGHRVRSAAEQLGALRADVADEPIHHGIKTGLLAQLDAPAAELARAGDARDELASFIALGQAQAGRHRRHAQVQRWVAAAKQIRVVLCC